MQFIELDYKSIRCLWKFLVGHAEITTVNVCQTTPGCGHWIMSVSLTQTSKPSLEELTSLL
jgi:hypothetical protein